MRKMLLALALFVTVGSYHAMAQGNNGNHQGGGNNGSGIGNGGGSGSGGTSGGVPLDGGLSLLVAAGVGYGAKKIADGRKKAAANVSTNSK